MTTRPGCLIAFEGLDQSGKETQAKRLLARFTSGGRLAEMVAFPDYGTPIGKEIERALAGERDYQADVMQLLYVANRYEWKPAIDRQLASGRIVIADRYLASSIAYGEAYGLDPAWLFDIQRFLPQPDLTLMLDIAPATAVQRPVQCLIIPTAWLSMVQATSFCRTTRTAGYVSWKVRLTPCL